jgi:serine/threonine-protein kinase
MTTDLRSQLQATLGSAYSLERELGGGGMSRVFVATETRLRRAVVVKVLSTELAAGVSADRFKREIQLAASLQQANIVPLLSAGDTEGVPYYTMPYVEGESVRLRLAKEGRLPVADAVSILRDVARALSYAHAHGVVHRDIKPDNILLSHGAAVVTDFGIAKAISAARTQAGAATLTQAGTSIGTPSYMAPEQVAGDPTADHRVDLYAFGCVAYELLAGQPPFTDTAPQKVLAAHLSQPPRPVRELRPDAPGALATLVMRCLDKQAEHRPADADELLRSLEAIATPSGGHSTGVAASMRRRRWTAPATLAAAVIVVLLGGWLAMQLLREPGAADSSIAVLPFANLSGDSANNYFGEGLAEEITGALAKAGLHVIGRGSARALAAKGLDVREIASQLGVGTVLQGNLQRDQDRVRVSVNLVSGRDGSVVWSEKYDKSARDIFALQDEIARAVATQLRATLAGGAGSQLVRRETADPEAHALYLQGLYLWNRRTGPAIRQAISLFGQAVARDSMYARAHAGIALAYTTLPNYEDGDADSLTERGRAAAARALAIDSTLAEAWTARAYASTQRFENSPADREFRRAIAYDPTFATARLWYSLLLTHVGRYGDALRESDAALRLEPASLVIRTARTRVFSAQRRFDDALATVQGALTLDSTYQLARYALGVQLAERGQQQSAIRELSALIDVPGVRRSEVSGSLAWALARGNRTAEARQMIDATRRAWGGGIVQSGAVAAALYELGDRDAALATLEAAVRMHDPWLTSNSRSPLYDKLRAEPRGRALLESTERP